MHNNAVDMIETIDEVAVEGRNSNILILQLFTKEPNNTIVPDNAGSLSENSFKLHFV